MIDLQPPALKVVAFSVHSILQTPSFAYFLIGFISSLLVVLGKCFSTLSKPQSPYLSKMLQDLMRVLFHLALVSTGLSIFLVVTLFMLANMGNVSTFRIWQIIHIQVLCWLGGVVLGGLIALPLVWYVIPKWAAGEGLTDAERILSKLKKLTAYDPLKYIDINKGCFVGLNHATKKPIYVPWVKINESHMQCLGATGSGKNVEMLLIGFQCILAGQAIVWVDPKADLRTPGILQRAAKSAGKNFHCIDLNPDQPCQFNLLAGCTENEVEELFVTGFDLQGQGGDADFYRGQDEDVAMMAARIAIKEQAMSIPELLQKCSSIPEITEQENFWRKFRKLASLPVIQTRKGLDLQASILNGDVIYFVGSCDNQRVKMLQKMLLVRIMQIIKKRDRFADNKPACVVLDEFKHLISPTALNALAVVRDFNSHFLIAHQSIGDLAEATNVSYAAAYGAVVNNTALKVIFKIADTEFAKQVSELAGTKKVFKESTSKSAIQIDGQMKASGTWIEDRDYRIPSEVITSLPMPKDRVGQAVVGLFYGVGDAQLFFSAPIKVTPLKIAVFAAEPLPVNMASNRVGDLI